MWHYAFEVKVYDGVDDRLSVRRGFVTGANYPEALNEIVDYFGDERIENITLSIAAESLLFADFESFNAIKEANTVG